jgi:16S rRNA processing protein RimM
MIAVGRISKSVGIRGEVTVIPLTDDPQRFARLETVWIGRDEATSEQYTIASVRFARSAVILKLNEIESRTVAETKRGNFVYIDSKDTWIPPAGSYFIHDIVGMEVLTDQGEVVGDIKEVLQMPANDVWVVARGKNEILIPAVKEVIVSVDMQRRTVVIHPMEGLLE